MILIVVNKGLALSGVGFGFGWVLSSSVRMAKHWPRHSQTWEVLAFIEKHFSAKLENGRMLMVKPREEIPAHKAAAALVHRLVKSGLSKVSLNQLGGPTNGGPPEAVIFMETGFKPTLDKPVQY